MDKRDKNIEKEFSLYKYKKYAILFELTRLKEKDLTKILMESPDSQAIPFLNLKLYEDEIEKGSIDIIFTSNSYFLTMIMKCYSVSFQLRKRFLVFF